MACSKDTKPLAADQENQKLSFQLGMDLMYRDGQDKNIPVAYDGYSANGFLHTARFKDDAKLTINDSNLQLINQLGFRTCLKLHLTIETSLELVSR